MEDKLRVLVSAYAVSPHHGSEPGVGWNLVIQLAKYCKVFVITESEFRTYTEEALKELPQKENLIFYFNDIGEKARRMCWNQGDYRFYYFYHNWQKKTLTIAKTIISEYRIDVMHQLNMIGYREPGYLWKIRNIPFVWGPIGGFNFVKASFLPSLGLKNAAFYFLKNSLNLIQAFTNRRVQKAVNCTNLLIAASGNNRSALVRFYGKDSILLNETGCHIPKEVYYTNNSKNETTFKILWVGRLIPTKLLGVALQSIRKLKHIKGLEFHIVGDGVNSNSKKYWQDCAHNYGVANICHWYGKIPHPDVQDLMRNSDLFFFTSIVEGTPHVILEAISNSLPILCFDTCGQGEIVTADIGRKIPLHNPRRSVQEFADEIEKLYQNRNLLHEMSANCKSKISGLSWEEKGKRIIELYYNLAK